MRVRVLIEQGVSGISLEGRSVIVAMCVGQLGSLLPHVVVPSILAAFLIPEWHLTGAQAGLLAGSGAAGYMLTVPVLATLTDRIDARKILIAGSAVSALGTLLFGLFASGLWSGAFFNAIAGVGLCRRLHAGPQGADRPACAGRFIPRDHALHVELLVRRRPVVSGFPTRRGSLGLARPHSLSRPLGPLVMLAVCLLLRPVKPKPAQGRLLDFAPVFQNTPGHGVRARLRRALLRALRHQDLDRRVLDVRGREEVQTPRS